MTKWTSEAEAREEIKALVAEYYHEFKEKKEPFKEGDRITYAARVFDENEMCALTDAALDFWLTTGRFSDEFEKKFAEWIGVKYAHLVNSGSSANLIAFSVLTAPELGERQIRRGDEVITVACGFPTTVTPVLQYGAVPVFVDVTVPQYNIDVTKLEAARSEKTKAVMIAHTLGNPFDLAAVKAFCDKYNLWLVEDNCDALGTQYTIDGVTKFTGTWGDIGTSSFYPPHHMTMGEGGCVYTNNPKLNRLILSYRDWGRDCICPRPPLRRPVRRTAEGIRPQVCVQPLRLQSESDGHAGGHRLRAAEEVPLVHRAPPPQLGAPARRPCVRGG